MKRAATQRSELYDFDLLGSRYNKGVDIEPKAGIVSQPSQERWLGDWKFSVSRGIVGREISGGVIRH